MAKPSVVFVLGGPGAGKGTQCSKIVQEFGYVHLSAGDLLRAERNSGSADGDLIDRYIKNGEIVPVAITVRLIEKAMIASPVQKFLVDGFPRNHDNLNGWNSHMEGKANVKFVLFMDCPFDICIERVKKRSQTSGRKDDNDETLRKRLNGYKNDTVPIIQHYEKQGLVRTVTSSDNVDAVYDRVRQCFLPD
ncbi:uncharacterized protein TRIADDRAFT_24660 [Trichoplax adhaerens]|uniref:UMP-CMP kinase n=1 Tax=Trichoplax adhaerens TaxID=10228 RepID=B3RTI6_TRIAD|nr:hypothetical protein TRIADDRAFT_24660 [Trichoplax adhaerens]EDV26140.1 hypothetical protein TRIADDRAFT_24660 [Trichoplax adhaerens]|eukprot:XP_002112173.1 hypothetical protein TRIADDRAFT_24660 [Trichoplax adhaerens]